MKVLIAEDDKDTAVLYKHALEEFQDVKKRTGPVQHIPFDAVILDYKMPRLDGMEVAKEILAINTH